MIRRETFYVITGDRKGLNHGLEIGTVVSSTSISEDTRLCRVKNSTFLYFVDAQDLKEVKENTNE